MSKKIDEITSRLEEYGYKKPETIQDLIDNRDILFNIISNIIDEHEKADEQKTLFYSSYSQE